MLRPPRFSDVCAALLRGGTPVRFAATGSSMSPAIRDGDVITVEPVRAEAVAVGDVVLYAGARGLIAHRVLEARRAGDKAFLARGDARGSTGERVGADQLLGRVASVERPAGRPILRQLARAARRWTRGARRILDARPDQDRDAAGAECLACGQVVDGHGLRPEAETRNAPCTGVGRPGVATARRPVDSARSKQ